MGTDQGKSGNVLGIGVVSRIQSKAMSSIGTTTFRPPYTPVTYGTIAGRTVGPFFDPVRKTPIHEWHLENGALFENVGHLMPQCPHKNSYFNINLLIGNDN